MPEWPNIAGRLAEPASRSEEHTSELQSRRDLVCRLLLEKKKRPPTPGLHLTVYVLPQSLVPLELTALSDPVPRWTRRTTDPASAARPHAPSLETRISAAL